MLLSWYSEQYVNIQLRYCLATWQIYNLWDTRFNYDRFYTSTTRYCNRLSFTISLSRYYAINHHIGFILDNKPYCARFVQNWYFCVKLNKSYDIIVILEALLSKISNQWLFRHYILKSQPLFVINAIELLYIKWPLHQILLTAIMNMFDNLINISLRQNTTIYWILYSSWIIILM